ncbi:MAG TPA: hypothetical protein VIX35_02020, partial [Vicinamibacterales bacterium]
IGEGDQGGRVKVLDFGLAKLDESVASGGSQTALPTALATGLRSSWSIHEWHSLSLVNFAV